MEILEYLRDQKVRCDNARISFEAGVDSQPHTMMQPMLAPDITSSSDWREHRSSTEI